MKKAKIILCSLISLFALGVIYFENNLNDEIVYVNTNKVASSNKNTLSLMYETAAGSGTYEVANNTNWPNDGYIFNENLSKCENGSKISWDDTNKKVVVDTSISDKCYVYFDVVGGQQ